MGRSLFLFGAGASAYSEDCLPNAPPLGDQLLERMVDDGFLNEDFMRSHGEAFMGPGGFEKGMASLTDRFINHQYMGFMRQMGRFFCRYTPGPNNVYVRLIEKLMSTGCEFGIASLNYETLIEQALERKGIRVLLNPGDLLQPHPGALFVIKPHGSCGFLPNPQGVSVWNLRIGFDVDVDAPTFFTTSGDSIDRWCLSEMNVDRAPAMSFYSPRKETRINPRLIRAHRQAWHQFCSHVDDVFIVGVRYNPEDPHIWEPLRNARRRVVFVNPSSSDNDDFMSWARDIGVTADVVAKGLAESFDDIVARVIE